MAQHGNDMERRAGYGSWYVLLHGSLVHLKEQHQAGTASASRCQKNLCPTLQVQPALDRAEGLDALRDLASESHWRMKHGPVRIFCDDARKSSSRDQDRGDSSIRTTAANMLPTLHNSHTIL
jgi:hypothetical protein